MTLVYLRVTFVDQCPEQILYIMAESHTRILHLNALISTVTLQLSPLISILDLVEPVIIPLRVALLLDARYQVYL
jgi:hypothetical protein